MTIKTTRYSDMGLERPIAVVGFPGAGLVSSIVPNYLVGQLSMTPLAGMSSPEMPPYCLIAGGLAMPPVRFYGRKGKGKNARDMIVCMSEYAPKPEDCYLLAEEILRYLKRMGCETIVCLEGVPRYTEEDVMMVRGCGENTRDLMRKTKLKELSNGMIRGMTGVMLYDGPGWGIDVISLVCPANQSLPDPGAAVGFLKPLSKLVPGLKVNPQPLMDEADQIKKRMDEQAAENNDLLSRQIYG